MLILLIISSFTGILGAAIVYSDYQNYQRKRKAYKDYKKGSILKKQL